MRTLVLYYIYIMYYLCLALQKRLFSLRDEQRFFFYVLATIPFSFRTLLFGALKSCLPYLTIGIDYK